MGCFAVHGDDAVSQEVIVATLAARHIGIVLFDGFALPEVAAIAEAFQSANVLADTSQSGGKFYDVALLSVAGGDMASSSSVFVGTESIDSFRQADNIHALFLVSGPETPNALRDDRFVIRLREASLRSELVFPTGEGRPVLEAAGFGQAANTRRYNEYETTQNATCNSVVSAPFNSLQAAWGVIQADLGSAIANQVADLAGVGN